MTNEKPNNMAETDHSKMDHSKMRHGLKTVQFAYKKIAGLK